jgi:hypothetical protein
LANEEKVLASVGSKKQMLVFTLGNYKGTKTLDVRKWEFRKGPGEFRPTRKGISLTDNTFRVVCNILGKHAEEITDWLQTLSNVSDQVDRDMDAHETSRLRSLYESGEFELERESWSSPEAFRCEAEGGTHRLTLNENHKLNTKLEALEAETNTTDARDLVAQLLVSYTRAKELFEDAPVMSPASLFDMLEFNWGCLLQNTLAESRKENE